ncbi:MAG: PulJ/GspJ family protein [Comamonas sp.]
MRNIHRGFTLIELLIAIAILAGMTVLSWRGIDGMVNAQQQARAYSDEVMVAQAALAQWSTDLNAIERVAQTTPLEWDGRLLRMTRRGSDIEERGLRVVAWSQQERDGTTYWLRWQSPPLRTVDEWRQAWASAAVWSGSPGADLRSNETRLMPVLGWQLLYFRENSWTNPLSAGNVNAPADVNDPTARGNRQPLPDGIRLTLQLPAPGALAGTLVQDWVNPLLGSNKS